MKVELIDYQENALDLLLKTKNTRLDYENDPKSWTHEQKMDHLSYMLQTIKSSWEFVNYTFRITGVSRAFTHQFVRTRTGKYAQQSQRTIDASEQDVVKPDIEDGFLSQAWDDFATDSIGNYKYLIEKGMPPQDARSLLPTNISTNIIAQFSLRTLHETAMVRLCTRAQGEYQRVFRAMRQEVINVHEWAEKFIQPKCVADGVCAFPMYGKKDCNVYHPILDRDHAKELMKEKFWESEMQEAIPVAIKGKAS